MHAAVLSRVHQPAGRGGAAINGREIDRIQVSVFDIKSFLTRKRVNDVDKGK